MDYCPPGRDHRRVADDRVLEPKHPQGRLCVRVPGVYRRHQPAGHQRLRRGGIHLCHHQDHGHRRLHVRYPDAPPFFFTPFRPADNTPASLLGIVINIGGFPNDGYIGGRFWHHPGAFNNGFKGVCAVFVTAAFAFTGTELVGLAAAETANPRKSLPTAIKQVFWRIAVFYIVSLVVVGLLVPYTEPRLLGATNMADALASPLYVFSLPYSIQPNAFF